MHALVGYTNTFPTCSLHVHVHRLRRRLTTVRVQESYRADSQASTVHSCCVGGGRNNAPSLPAKATGKNNKQQGCLVGSRIHPHTCVETAARKRRLRTARGQFDRHYPHSRFVRRRSVGSTSCLHGRSTRTHADNATLCVYSGRLSLRRNPRRALNGDECRHMHRLRNSYYNASP